MSTNIPLRNSFQLFSYSEEAQTLKQTVKKRFANKFIYSPQQQQTPSHHSTDRLPHSCEQKSSKPSLLQNNFTYQSKPKPIILKKKSLLLHRLTVDQRDKFRKDIQRSREQTEDMRRKMRGTHIPLLSNGQISSRKWSKENTCYQATIDSQSRKGFGRVNVFFE